MIVWLKCIQQWIVFFIGSLNNMKVNRLVRLLKCFNQDALVIIKNNENNIYSEIIDVNMYENRKYVYIDIEECEFCKKELLNEN